MIEGTYQWRHDRIPTWGKDHLVLADWRLSTPRRKWSRHSQDSETGVFEYEFERPGNRKQLVSLESGAETPFPSLNDDQFLIGLLTLSEMAGCPELLRFQPSHLLKILRRADCQNNFHRARGAIKRYQALSAHFEGLWFDRKASASTLNFSSGIIADFGFESSRGRRKQTAQRSSYVQWTKSFHESLKHGNLININLEDLAQCCARPGAMQLFRITNKVWHGGRKPSVYERDLKELACGQLRMKNDKWTKRNFQNIVAWMEKHEYLKPLDREQRYTRIAHGIWRVRLEIHPSRIAERDSKSTNSSVGADTPDEATQLVQAYIENRFDRKNYQPTKKDKDRAQVLLSKASLKQLVVLVPEVVQTVRAKRADDLHFGFAEPTFLQALENSKKIIATKKKQTEETSRRRQQQNQTSVDTEARKSRRESLLREWQTASDVLRQQCVSQAVNLAKTQADVDCILDSSLEAPAPEVLKQLEASLSTETVHTL